MERHRSKLSIDFYYELCDPSGECGELHTLYWGGFPDQGSNPGSWSQASNGLPNIKCAVCNLLASESRDSIL